MSILQNLQRLNIATRIQLFDILYEKEALGRSDRKKYLYNYLEDTTKSKVMNMSFQNSRSHLLSSRKV
ncbi:unnamed protein product [Acanthoscelides obtectus]|uniref:Uncharacterized protein n=1 Tax=Acanthoscelides obtectus TaxID=200917 RepID=A0A9P0KTI8_ACAOB|nr:unnamed protein product [Acanthoscelides obtectus]CAK1672119.1 hypothetical protein AOBTE_LOCUS28657 [Acanthoscelides obtectus]